jgi:5'-methylthioadenosine phosphorylase
MGTAFGVIGGTGFYGFAGEAAERVEVATRYGQVEVQRSSLGAVPVFFLARHGAGHAVPPHRVNYRANIAALRELGVGSVLASAAVGSMAKSMPPGALVIVEQFLDFTRTRTSTFFDGEGGVVKHVDVSDPYCPHLRSELRSASAAVGEELAAGATYVCTEGPRFETPAEIRMFRRLGGDLVGMTSVPEVTLAREAGLCYASVAVVTNWAAGVSEAPVVHEEVTQFMSQQAERLKGIFAHVIGNHKEIECPCRAWARS